MNIYLIRHTKAEVATHLKKDRERELTEEGIKILKASIEVWKKSIDGYDFILSSPFKRALQTAKIIAESYNYKDEIICDSSLSPGSTVNTIIQLVESLKGERMAFIGHQPDIGFQVSSLISNSEFNQKVSPASLINISFDDNLKVGQGTLKFLLPPVIV